MECTLCFEIYSDNTKKPRNLECGHTFCEECLTKIYCNSSITCPSCRRQSSILPKSLPVNFIAADLARRHTEERKRLVFCNLHPKESIRFFCNTCSSGICVECIITHCGHLFVKQEDSIKLLQHKISEVDSHISKITDKNNSIKFEIKEIAHSLENKLQKEFRSIDYEYNTLFEELTRRRDKIKELYRDMIENETRSILEGLPKIEEKEKQLKLEKDRLSAYTTLANSLQDSNPAVREVNQEIQSIKESILCIASDLLPNISPPVMIPVFEMAKNTIEFISNIGTISCAAGRDVEVIDPTICFFGDKNKVMAYKINENSWEMRTCDSKFEFNYYAASATLPEGSSIITGGGSSNSVLIYKDKKLFPAQAMTQIRKEHAAVYLNSYIYAIGGYDGANNQFLNECEKYCIFSGEWSNCASMLVARCAFSATSVNNKYIFIFGGYDGSQRLASIERYNPEIDSWCMINTTLRFQLSNCGCFSPYFNKVIVLGGGFSSGFSHAVEMLDIESLEWTSMSFMNEGRDLRNKLTYFKGGAFCVGGYNFMAEVFNVENETWTQLPNYLVSDNLDSWSSALTYRIN